MIASEISTSAPKSFAGRRRLAKCIARDIALFRGPVFGYPPVLLWKTVEPERVKALWHEFFQRRRSSASRPAGIFINIPFCDVRCGYCDYVTTIGMRESALAAYPGAIKRELDFLDLPPTALDSLYMSGGNMALYPPRLLERIFELVYSRFHFSDNAHLKIGLSHSEIREDTAQVFSRWRIQEAVIQVQTLDPEFSKTISRAVEPGALSRTCDRLRAAGISHIKIDWMAGIPGQTEASFKVDLAEILRARPDEIVVTPFSPGAYSPIESISGMQWRPAHISMKNADVTKRERRVRIARQWVADYCAVHLHGRSERAWPPAEERRSTLGLGFGALSRIFGEMYCTSFRSNPDGETAGPERGGPSFFGIEMSADREKRRHIVERIMERGEFSLSFFEETFGGPPDLDLTNELQELNNLGYLRRDEDVWRVPKKSKLHQGIAAGMLYEGEFSTFFESRMKRHPEQYANVDRNLVELYGL